MNRNLLWPGMLLPVPHDSKGAYIPTQFCHFCGMQSIVSGPLFVSICLLTAGIQNCPAGSAPVPAAALPAPATATSRGQRASPRRRRRQRPASGAAGAGHGQVRGGSASIFAAGAGRGQRSLSSPWCTSSSPGPSQQVAPAASRSRALIGVAVLDLFLAAAIPAGGARRGHVCVGIAGIEILQRGSCRKHIK